MESFFLRSAPTLLAQHRVITPKTIDGYDLRNWRSFLSRSGKPIMLSGEFEGLKTRLNAKGPKPLSPDGFVTVAPHWRTFYPIAKSDTCGVQHLGWRKVWFRPLPQSPPHDLRKGLCLRVPA